MPKCAQRKHSQKLEYHRPRPQDDPTRSVKAYVELSILLMDTKLDAILAVMLYHEH
ncbi:hypothetical protein CERZMDRAFT_90241, partial [Cercospora zeae-maydis SCOH1-5]